MLDIYFVLRIFHFMKYSGSKRSCAIPLGKFADRLDRLMRRLTQSQITQERNYLARGLITIPLERFADRLDRLMHRLTQSQITQERNYLARGLITIPQMLILHLVAERKTCTMRTLAQSLDLKGSTLTGIVDRLVSLGLLKRFNSEADRRAVLAEITPKGRKILEHLCAEKRKFIMNLFKHVSSQERAAILEIMGKIVQTLSVTEAQRAPGKAE